MKKTFKLITALTLIIIMVVLTASAAINWDYITSVGGTISYSGSTGYYYGYIETAGADRIEATATLYYKNSGGNWIESTSWDYDVDTEYVDINETFKTSSSREYKVVLRGTVYSGSDSETVTYTAM